MSPVALRHGLRADTAASPASQARRLACRAGFVEEDQAVDLLTHVRLASHPPILTRLTDILALIPAGCLDRFRGA